MTPCQHDGSRRNGHWLWRIAVIVIGLSLAEVCHQTYAMLQPTPRIQNVRGGSFFGEWDGRRVIAFLEFSHHEWRGTLEIEGDDQPFRLVSAREIADGIEFELESSGRPGTELVGPQQLLIVRWEPHGDLAIEDRSSTKPRCVGRLVTVAGSQALTRTAGLAIADRGRRIAFQGVMPVFPDATVLERSFQSAVQERLTDSSEIATWPWDDWEDFFNSCRHGSPSSTWTMEESWRLTYRSPMLVSSVCDLSRNTGGAHPNYAFESLTMYWNGHAGVPVQLEDLFREGSDWRAALAHYCEVDLQRQEASSPQSNPEDFGQLSTFAIFQSGIQVQYAPYSVGCFAEGSYRVLIPFAVFEEFLKDYGPAIYLPRPRNHLPRDRRSEQNLVVEQSAPSDGLLQADVAIPAAPDRR